MGIFLVAPVSCIAQMLMYTSFFHKLKALSHEKYLNLR